MYRVDRNDFFRNTKDSTVYTPASVSRYLFGLVSGLIDRKKPVLDPCVGGGALLAPFDEAKFNTIGIDIEDQGYPGTRLLNYLEVEKGALPPPALVIMNPPFNIDRKTKRDMAAKYGRRPLLPEVWLQKAIELFGKEVPIILFTPYGMRLNLTRKSARWVKFASGQYPEISSIVSMPKDVFDGILFHSEVLIFNLPDLKGHYFCD